MGSHHIYMRENLKQYLYDPDPFILFGTEHILALLLFLGLWIWLPRYAKNELSSSAQESLGRWISYFVAGTYIAWPILEIMAGTFDAKLHLPFHLCRITNILLPFVMIYKKQIWFELIFFWGLSGMLQASITPDITQGFPHFHFIRFFIGHSGLVLAIMYAIVVYGLRPRVKGIWIAMIGINIVLFIAFLVNTALDSNYFWIRGKPPVPSLLDYMGPWPWYIMWSEFLALGHFIIAYSPFYFLNKRKQKNE